MEEMTVGSLYPGVTVVSGTSMVQDFFRKQYCLEGCGS